MTPTKAERQADDPVLETDSYRIWDAKGLSAQERARAGKICLAVEPGERMHEIVVLNVGCGCALKVLSKERIKDGRIRALLRVEEPGDKVSVASWEWLSRSEYEKRIRAFKSIFGEDCVTLIRGEGIHAGVAKVLRRARKRNGRKDEGGADRSSAGPGKRAVNTQGGDKHGG